MFLFCTLLILGGVIAFYMGKLPAYLAFLVGALIFLKVALIIAFIYLASLVLARPDPCCCRR